MQSPGSDHISVSEAALDKLALRLLLARPVIDCQQLNSLVPAASRHMLDEELLQRIRCGRKSVIFTHLFAWFYCGMQVCVVVYVSILPFAFLWAYVRTTSPDWTLFCHSNRWRVSKALTSCFQREIRRCLLHLELVCRSPTSADISRLRRQREESGYQRGRWIRWHHVSINRCRWFLIATCWT